MVRVRTSQPTTPSTGRFDSIRRPTSTATTPIARFMQALNSPEEETAARTHPLPTPVPSDVPLLPAPQMSRSVSEPQALSDLGGFAPHQMPRGRSGSISLVRGRGLARPRSATVNLQPPIGFGDGRRGRSPGPRLPPLRASSSSLLGLAAAGRLRRGSTTASATDFRAAGESAETTSVNESEDGQGGSVVRRDLGIEDMFRSSRGRGRGRGRPNRGRATTH